MGPGLAIVLALFWQREDKWTLCSLHIYNILCILYAYWVVCVLLMSNYYAFAEYITMICRGQFVLVHHIIQLHTQCCNKYHVLSI